MYCVLSVRFVGKGESSYHYQTDLSYGTSPGGKDSPGRSVSNNAPRAGSNGHDGQVTIYVEGSSSSSSSSSNENGTENISATTYIHMKGRYDLNLNDFVLTSSNSIQENEIFEYSDYVDVTNMTVLNFGNMIMPIQGTKICIQDWCINTCIVPHKSTKQFGWMDQRVLSLGTGTVEGKTTFHVGFVPKIRELSKEGTNDDDIGPYKMKQVLILKGTQFGPYGFRRDHTRFHEKGKMLTFQFPVENTTGLEGLSTICPGSGMHFQFKLKNISRNDLGSKSQGQRQLFVQIYRNKSSEYAVPSKLVDMKANGIECNKDMEMNINSPDSTIFKGTQIPIEFLASGETTEINGILKFHKDVEPYHRFAFQAEILLQDIRHNDDDSHDETKSFTPVQIRKMVVKSESGYRSSKRNHVVLVTSSATTKHVFNAWVDVLKSMKLKVEYFSVSVYGSLTPEFRLKKPLKDLFRNKLVIILDEKFRQEQDNRYDYAMNSEMEPSRMLPWGIQVQTSGYDESTKWLLVGPSEVAIRQALAAHFTAPPGDVSTYKSVKEFSSAWSELLATERKAGVITDKRIFETYIEFDTDVDRSNKKDQIAKIKEQHTDKKVNKIKKFLEEEDPLRSYIIEFKNGRITVRRGYCRTENSTHVLSGDTNNVTMMKRAVLKSLPLDKFHMTFANAIIEGVNDGDGATVEIFLDIYTQKLLWDVSNILEGELLIKNVDKLSDVLPTIATCMFGNIHFKRIIDHHAKSSEANDHYHAKRIADVMSRLLARFNCVARSKDLNPKESSSKYVQRALHEAIGLLENEWSPCIDADRQKEEYKTVKTSAKEYIKEKHGIFASREVESRWLHALLYVCSYRNKEKYSDIQDTGGNYYHGQPKKYIPDPKGEKLVLNPAYREWKNQQNTAPRVTAVVTPDTYYLEKETVHQLCEMEENGHEKLCEFIVPLKLVLSEDECLALQKQVDQDQLAASNISESINATRVRETIKPEKKKKKKKKKKRDKKKE